MIISTKGRYALGILADLALLEDGKFASVKDISENQKISLKYLESITASLHKAGFLESRRGRSGGYRLAKKPTDITLYSIFDSLEDSVSVAACLDYEGVLCGREKHCAGYPLWEKLQKIVNDYLTGVTLDDLLKGNI